MIRTAGWMALLIVATIACFVGGTEENGFRELPAGDVIATFGAAASVPDGAVGADLVIALDMAPFYTTSATRLAFLPAFTGEQSLETGLAGDLWTASVDVDLSLVPWALDSTGGWIEFHPPEWTLADQPRVCLDGDIGWGPRWAPPGAWTHALAAHLDLTAAWSIETVWDSVLTLSLGALSMAHWTLFAGPIVGDLALEAGAETFLPLLASNSRAVRGHVNAVIGLLPAFDMAFEVGLELSIRSFYAYASFGAGSGGVRAEVGAEAAIGL